MTTKVNPPRSITAESDRAVEFLGKISELLKHQRRHFDDAVVMHCIHLIQEYAQDNLREVSPELQTSAGTDRRG